MLVVAALGGNALLRRGEPLTVRAQRANVRAAAGPLAAILRAGHGLVVTHGNGPQIGLLASQGEASAEGAYPLDVLGAETDGMIGYLIEQELENALGHDRPVATLLTQIEVDPDDPAFERPTKFVGPVHDRETAERMAAERGWHVARDGATWRRVVSSPAPRRIPDLRVVRLLLEHGVTLICAGGGGIPVMRRDDGSLAGVEAVIDKDHASALLAREIGADALLLLTDVEAVFDGFGGPDPRAIRALSPEAAMAMTLPEGSMGPKLAAAAGFAARSDALAGIGRLEDAVAILEGASGTLVRDDGGAGAPPGPSGDERRASRAW